MDNKTYNDFLNLALDFVAADISLIETENIIKIDPESELRLTIKNPNKVVQLKNDFNNLWNKI
jgi:hypothetical protein